MHATLREGRRVKWYKHDPSSALAGMIGLTVEERGAYYTLIDLLYARAPHNDVTDDLVIRALAVRPQVWRRLKAGLMAKGKVHETDGKLTANRVETEVKLAVNLMDKGGVSRGRTQQKQEVNPRAVAPTTTTTTILESSLGKGGEATQARPAPASAPPAPSLPPVVDYRDPGNDYRSPPRTKSDNVLQPLPDKQLLRRNATKLNGGAAK
jgi:uncharacterized protein YdaU (DUF1376 family)